MTEELVERLTKLNACDPGCYGRCKVCPDDVARDAAAELLRLSRELTAEKAARVRAERERARPTTNQGHDEPCYYCHNLCNSFAGNPSEWPIPLCHADDPGHVKWHHTGCVSERLSLAASLQERVGELEKDARRLDSFEREADNGGCPALLSDDNGHWAVATLGVQSVLPEGEPMDITTSFYVEAKEWKHTVRAAIDAALAQGER